MEFINRNPKIIIISGKASSGKSLSANIIKENTNNTILLAYADYLKMYAKNISGWDGSEDTKPRELLQQLGVELIKNNINENMLINRIIEDIKVYDNLSAKEILYDLQGRIVKNPSKGIYIKISNNNATKEVK